MFSKGLRIRDQGDAIYSAEIEGRGARGYKGYIESHRFARTIYGEDLHHSTGRQQDIYGNISFG